jgi:hypothetical protein
MMRQISISRRRALSFPFSGPLKLLSSTLFKSSTSPLNHPISSSRTASTCSSIEFSHPLGFLPFTSPAPDSLSWLLKDTIDWSQTLDEIPLIDSEDFIWPLPVSISEQTQFEDEPALSESLSDYFKLPRGDTEQVIQWLEGGLRIQNTSKRKDKEKTDKLEWSDEKRPDVTTSSSNLDNSWVSSKTKTSPFIKMRSSYVCVSRSTHSLPVVATTRLPRLIFNSQSIPIRNYISKLIFLSNKTPVGLIQSKAGISYSRVSLKKDDDKGNNKEETDETLLGK